MADIPQSHSATKPKIFSEENLLGFQDHGSIIVGYLREPKEELDVISTIGMPGLGKTTLARKIFKSDFVKHEFPNRIWVNVSQKPNIRNVLLNILKEFTSDDVSGLSDPTLMETVEYYLKERKFFLVLDDVWTTDAWNDIRNVLPESNNMSNVLITSCEKSVGEKATRSYELPLLTGPQSWELLQYHVFGELGKSHRDLKAVGECIARNCHGFPLSVMLIGGILAGQDDENISAIKEEWLKVSKFLKNDKKKQVSDIVELSYNKLPDELKDCLLYFAVFPEDYEISVWKLIRLWIAEGLIQGKNPEETVEEYVKDLISRNLVMIVKRTSKGEVKTCRVHDAVHAFCGLKVLQEQQRFFLEMKCVNGDLVPPLSEIGKPRRLCIHSDLEPSPALVVYTKNKSLPMKANIWKMVQLRHLKTNAVITEIAEGDGGGFHSLHFLLIEDTKLFNLEMIVFLNLGLLCLESARNLKEIPDGVVGSLEKLNIEHLSASGVETAKKIDEMKNANQPCSSSP
ncbi:toMV susceptible protein tm-2-like [Salvia splendens]|uniref:toMV susceptible protein tm-2-like n=1 Tax=Salvia splendens TaxID=180675 RepID=UPI001C25ACE1|nr:toMV susceptible protein tm-2-like [Salvia splendens]